MDRVSLGNLWSRRSLDVTGRPVKQAKLRWNHLEYLSSPMVTSASRLNRIERISEKGESVCPFCDIKKTYLFYVV